MFNSQQIVDYIDNLILIQKPNDNQISELIGKITSSILNSNEIKNHYTKEEIVELVEDYTTKTLLHNINNRKVFLKNQLDVLDQQISVDLKKWVVIFPLENIEIKIPRYKIGDVSFFKMNSYHKNNIRKVFDNIINLNQHYNMTQKNQFKKDFKDRMLEPLKNKYLAKVIIFARKNKVKVLGMKKIVNALNIIKLYWQSVNDGFGIRFGIYGSNIGHKNRVILQYAVGGESFNHSIMKVGPLTNMVIDRNKQNHMDKYGFKKLVHILTKTNKTNFEVRLLTAINWYARAFDTTIDRLDKDENDMDLNPNYMHYAERMIRLTIALESLFILDSSENIQSNIADRIAYLSTDKYNDRKKCIKYIKNMYSYRSAIVHHGETPFSKDEVDNFMMNVQHALIILIKRKDRLGIKTDTDYRKWFDKQKYG